MTKRLAAKMFRSLILFLTLRRSPAQAIAPLGVEPAGNGGGAECVDRVSNTLVERSLGYRTQELLDRLALDAVGREQRLPRYT